jgi:hypothetical protein
MIPYFKYNVINYELQKVESYKDPPLKEIELAVLKAAANIDHDRIDKRIIKNID